MFRTQNLLKLLTSLLVPLLLVLGAVQVLATDPYLAFEYGKAGFPTDPYGFDRAQRLEFASATLRWVRQGQPIEALAAISLDDKSLYNQQELKHMQDVRDVFLATRRVWHFALGLFVLIGLFLAYRNESLQELAQGLKIGGLLAAGLVALIGLLAVLTWQVWFVVFHQVFFDPGTWTFNTSDTLIRLFPERFWYDAALTISGLSLIGGLGAAVIGWYVQRKSQYVPIPYRAQSFKPSKG